MRFPADCYFRSLAPIVFALVFSGDALSQQTASGTGITNPDSSVAQNSPKLSGTQPEPESKRLFWIIPNNRTAPSFSDFKPITPKDKFKIAEQDAFDRGTFALAALFAGESQLTDADKSFG